MNGPVRLLFLPGPQIVISDATIADPETRAGLAELSIAKLTVDLNFADLFSREVDAKRIVLERPVLTLHPGHQAQAGHLDGARAPGKVRFARANMSGSVSEPPRDLRIEDLRIVDGTVILARSNAQDERCIEHIDAHLSLTSLKAPLIGRGTFQWKHEPVDFSFEFSTPADLRAKRAGELQAAFDTQTVSARFEGSVATAPHLAGEGRLSAKVGSIPALLAWFRGESVVSPAIGDGELDSLVAWTKDEIILSKTRFAAEHASGEGEAVITLKRPRPHIRAAFALDHLDASPLFRDADRREASPKDAAPLAQRAFSPMTGTTTDGSKPNAPAAEAEQAVSPPPPFAAPEQPGSKRQQPAPSLAQPPLGLAQPTLSLAHKMPEAALGRATTPQVPHKVRPAPFDADVNLNVRKARMGQLNIGPSALGVVFRDGTLNATLSGMSLYDGNASGTLTVDASTSVPQFSGNFRLEGVQARPFLTDAA